MTEEAILAPAHVTNPGAPVPQPPAASASSWGTPPPWVMYILAVLGVGGFGSGAAGMLSAASQDDVKAAVEQQGELLSASLRAEFDERLDALEEGNRTLERRVQQNDSAIRETKTLVQSMADNQLLICEKLQVRCARR